MSCADCLHIEHEIIWGYGHRVYKCAKDGEYYFDENRSSNCKKFILNIATVKDAQKDYKLFLK